MSAVCNSVKRKRERIGRLVQMQADKRDEIDEVLAGDIAAVVGLKGASHRRHAVRREEPAVVLERMEFPDAGHRRSPSSRRRSPTRTSSEPALAKLAMEDPSFRVQTWTARAGRPSSPGWVSCIWRSSSTGCCAEFKVDANVGKPQVAYRETITREVESEGKYIRQSGGKGQYGHIWLTACPERGREGSEVRERDCGRKGSAGIRVGRRARGGRVDAVGSSCRLPPGGHSGDCLRWKLPRRRLERSRLQDRRFDGPARRGGTGRPGAPRAGDGLSRW